MLVFSTRFPLKNDVPMEECVRIFTDWIIQSPHYGINSIDYDAKSNTNFELIQEPVKIFIKKISLPHGGLIACRLEYSNAPAVYRFDCIILNESGEKSVLIQLNRNCTDFNVKLPHVKKPYIVRSFIEKGLCKDDAGIPISDTPLTAEEYFDICAAAINGTHHNALPVVYVSRDYWNTTAVNTTHLAQQLGGVAHVFVESKRDTSFMLRDATDGKNVYTGYVGIYFPKSTYCRKFAIGDYRTPKEMSRAITNTVWGALINRLDSSFYNWNQIAAMESKQKLIEWESKHQSEDIQINQFIADCDEEIRDLHQQIDRLNTQLLSAQSKGDFYQSRISDLEQALDCRDTFYKPGSVHCLYPSERNDLLYSILSQVKGRFPDDSHARRLIDSMLEANPRKGDWRKIKEGIHAVLSDGGKLNGSKKSKLSELGFTITEEGKHYKMTFRNPEYMFTTSKTPSDYCSGDNLASEICKKLDIEWKI